mmetsp:Transcript_75708/g.202510  ORF Transcript_75708/g.202510 Transcript_75708/m.202510 type:complete len:254 (-) Transcript_75708:496-1257(-)
MLGDGSTGAAADHLLDFGTYGLGLHTHPLRVFFQSVPLVREDLLQCFCSHGAVAQSNGTQILQRKITSRVDLLQQSNKNRSRGHRLPKRSGIHLLQPPMRAPGKPNPHRVLQHVVGCIMDPLLVSTEDHKGGEALDAAETLQSEIVLLGEVDCAERHIRVEDGRGVVGQASAAIGTPNMVNLKRLLQLPLLALEKLQPMHEFTRLFIRKTKKEQANIRLTLKRQLGQLPGWLVLRQNPHHLRHRAVAAHPLRE